jgi:hypothetical protein
MAWQAYGGEGNIVGVPYDDSIVVSGRSEKFFPADVLDRFLAKYR